MDKRILLVEDDDFLRQLYVDLLVDAGFTPDTAADGQAAYAKIAQGSWDLVLLDVMLPKMTGFEIIAKLEAEGKKPKFPIIFMTNLDGSDDDKEKLSLATAYWIKSNMSPPDFIKKVQTELKL